LNPFKHVHAGKQTPLEQAFERYYPAIFQYFRYRGADADTAKDLASSTFERALVHLDQYDPRKAQIQTWLFTIARNLAINHWKSESHTPLAPLEEDLPMPEAEPLEDAIILSQDKQQILSALASLDARAVEIVALKFGGRLTNRQIANLTGLTESNTGIIIYRALARLRLLLAETHTEARHEH